jgi:hypothetical protein
LGTRGCARVSTEGRFSMMLEGSCLCGDVAWRVDGPVSPVESCHCSRCRKSSGSAFLPMLAVRPRDFRFLRGEDRVQVFRLPVLRRPPGYTRPFCGRCGSPVPLLDPQALILEIPAGTLNGDPGVQTKQHIFTDYGVSWHDSDDGLPRYPGGVPEAERAWRAVLDDDA